MVWAWGGGGVRCTRTLDSPLGHYPRKGQGNRQYIVGTVFVMAGLLKICAEAWLFCILYTYVFGSQKTNNKSAH